VLSTAAARMATTKYILATAATRSTQLQSQNGIAVNHWVLAVC